tara:strand:- start:828 stop:1073 length:246 start_codon:yes stop_codon:yes gene_type:complete
MIEKQDIRELLENLGSKVSLLAEENRVCKNRDDAGKQLIALLKDYISEQDWLDLYKSIDDIYVKELMIEWGPNLFPVDFKK